jgi:hypothetical protein
MIQVRRERGSTLPFVEIAPDVPELSRSLQQLSFALTPLFSGH